jgi:hypothetical protein
MFTRPTIGGECFMRSTLALWLTVSCVVISAVRTHAEQPVAIQEVHVAPSGDRETIDVHLSAVVIPGIIVASHPDRLVLQFPNTAVPRRQQVALVDQNGVKTVRIGLNKAKPPVTRVVIDLNRAHPYSVVVNGSTITLTVLPAAGESAGAGNSEPEATELGSSEVASVARGPLITAVNSTAHPARKGVRTKFAIKYVAEGAAYLNAGRNAGLAPGMKLLVRDSGSSRATSAQAAVIAELEVVSVAQNSAVTEIHQARRDLRAGDWAYLSQEDVERLSAERSLQQSSTWLHGNAFLERTNDARPPEFSPDEGHIRARVGLDYSSIRSSGSTEGSTTQRGLTIQADITRIGGSYWNLQGYWRGRLTQTSQPLEGTMQDYLDRTYTMQLYFDNPGSAWVAGVGRLYLPWAASLDTIDGAYIGRRFAPGMTAGIFAGSTPDPASWHYSPNQQIAGSFVNFEGGSYDSVHYSSTAGLALNMLKWKIDRPFLFLENGVSLNRYFSIYHSLIVDSPQGVSTDGIRPGTGVSRSYLTFHVQPVKKVSFDLYHNYFRDVPTAPTQLIETGLVDKLLYRGLNLGVRVEPINHIAVYASIGQSDKSGDSRRTQNLTYGFTWSEIGRSGFRADVHYSRFASPYAQGDYRILTLTRHLGDRMLWDTQLGAQTLFSSWTANTRSMFFDTSFDTNLTGHTYFQTGYTISHGAQLNYDQWYVSLGYRFDAARTAGNR